MTKADFLDEPPQSETITAYDREHAQLYLRLLDAVSDGADWRDVSQVLFGLDPAHDPERARRVHDTHLARAHWMTSHGYRSLVQEDRLP